MATENILTIAPAPRRYGCGMLWEFPMLKPSAVRSKATTTRHSCQNAGGNSDSAISDSVSSEMIRNKCVG